MNIELINWTAETGGRIIKIDCKINEKIRLFYVLDSSIKKVFLEYFAKDGINPSNIVDFMNGKDPKYKMDDYHKLFFIQEFFTI